MSSSQQLLLGEGAGGSIPNYIEEVFSTYLYTGNGSTQTITNGIDLSTKGGLIWAKARNTLTTPPANANWNHLFDSARGFANNINSNETGGQYNQGTVTATSSGFSLSSGATGAPNDNAGNYVSWTFREQPKFFDIVTYTGDGIARTIAHNLGSVPGCIIVKKTSAAGQWCVYHRGLTSASYAAFLNLTDAETNDSAVWNATNPTSTVFSVGTSAGTNTSGATYVAYLFAHDAGGFGLSGTDNVISCGSYTGNGSATGPVVTLGYEPQWVMVKQSSASGQYWNMIDIMRGFDVSTGAQTLGANAADAEYTNAGFGSGTPIMSPTATGFQVRSAQPATNANGETYIYIAIRRGPMKVPTLGTSVYNAIARTGTGADATVTGAGFTPDFLLCADRSSGNGTRAMDRLRGPARRLDTYQTDLERTPAITSFDMNGFTTPDGIANAAGVSYINWLYKRAPGFFDEVCYTGTGVDLTVNHNLGVVPEWVIIKNRSRAGTNWSGAYFANASEYYDLRINQDIGRSLNTMGPLGPTLISNSATTFGVLGGSTLVNFSGDTYVAYLFATCAGVSKVGSYTGNGTTQTIDCGFTGGARFVLIKRTDASGDWYVYDTVRGMTVLTDPYLWLNSTAAEVATLGSVTTVSTGFALNSAILAAINVSAGTYIFLAIA